MRRVFLSLGWALYAAAVAWCVLVILGSPGTYACKPGHEIAELEKQARPTLVEVLVASGRNGITCVGTWIDQNRDDINAVSTLIIAIFAGTLWWSANTQAHLTREAIDLTRRGYIASHRPKIIVQAVVFVLDVVEGSDGARVGANVIYFNAGETRAKIVSIVARIARRRWPLQPAIPLMPGVATDPEIPVPSERIHGGARGEFRVASDAAVSHERRVQLDLLRRHGADWQTYADSAVVCIGRIVYEDDRRIRRETGFCRKLDAANERWLPVGETEYDYAY